jgi:DNA-binding beta-propeller fold protein YncE
MVRIKAVLIALMLGFLAMTGASAQWTTELKSPGAAEQMRLGVLAYHQGRYAEAILLFEKSLAYDPGAPLTRYWLGLSYLRTGYEATALKALEPLLDLADAPSHLRSLVESLHLRRSLGASEAPPRYVESTRFEGRKPQSPAFLRPASILPLADGTFMVVAQGSSQILRMDPNGVVKERITGGLSGLDRPFGVAELPDGTIFISEFNGDRIARISKGQSKLFFSSGRGEGQLLGPQYLAFDDAGYLYVCDYGNSRIVKFDPSGAFVLSIGAASGDFKGFASPSGIACVSDVVYIADSAAKAIYRFDASGNYLGTLAQGSLHFPEGLSTWNSGRALLVADTDRVVSVDLETERVDELYRSPDAKPRIVGAVADHNGNILACDFDASVVSVLSEAPSLAQGYQVSIDRIDATLFPKVRLQVSVRDRTGQPVVGLSASNFYLSESLHGRSASGAKGSGEIRITESIAPAAKVVFEGSGNISTVFRTVALIDRSKAMDLYADSLRASLVDLGTAIGTRGSLGLVLAGSSPVLAAKPSPGPDLRTLVRALQTATGGESRFDLGLRQAADVLLPGEVRDSIVFFTTGSISDASFQGTSISELGSLLRNNGIRFNAVIFGEARPDPSIVYLAQVTGGSILSAARPRGLGDLADLLEGAPSGRYAFSFESADNPEFGTRQLFVAVEAYLYQKSGRDELGYYAPLK